MPEKNTEPTRRDVLRAGAGAATVAAVGLPLAVERVEATDSGEPELQLEADMPTGTELELRVYEDRTGSGTADATEDIVVFGGFNKYVLSSFEGTELDNRYDYWIKPTKVDDNENKTFSLYAPVSIVLPEGQGEPEGIAVDILSDNAPVDFGTEYEAEVELINEGSSQESQTITMEADRTQVDSQGVTVPADKPKTTTLSWTPGSSDVGNVEIRVYSDDDVDITSIEVSSRSVDPDPEITAPQSPSGDRYLDYWLTGDVFNGAHTPYSDLLGPVGALVALIAVGGSIQIFSDTTTMPLVITVILSGTLIGAIALPGQAITIAVILIMLGLAFLGAKLYVKSGRRSR